MPVHPQVVSMPSLPSRLLLDICSPFSASNVVTHAVRHRPSFEAEPSHPSGAARLLFNLL